MAREIERQSVNTEPITGRYPKIRGGVCDYCGVLDGNIPSYLQYTLCRHFKGLGEIKCSYCEETKNPRDTVLQSIIQVAEHPDNSDKLVVWCDSYTCSAKHIARFRINR